MAQKKFSIFALVLFLGSFAILGNARADNETLEMDNFGDRFGIGMHDHEGGRPGGEFRWIQQRLERAEQMISDLQSRLGYVEQRINQPQYP
ncbi:MAG: hypothetical protein ABIQ95_14800, partial [Bdellovibrionia bacterium]